MWFFKTLFWVKHAHCVFLLAALGVDFVLCENEVSLLAIVFNNSEAPYILGLHCFRCVKELSHFGQIVEEGALAGIGVADDYQFIVSPLQLFVLL